ncbi:MAG: hypothetical protein ACKO5E_13205 [bacterium]
MPKNGRHGIYDLSGCRLSDHARLRLAERFGPEISYASIPEFLLQAMMHARKLGTDPENETGAYLIMVRSVPCVLLLKAETVLTFLKPEQFETVMANFGRHRWPTKVNRWLRRIEGRSDEKSEESE